MTRHWKSAAASPAGFKERLIAWSRAAGLHLEPDEAGHFNLAAGGLPVRFALDVESHSALLGALMLDEDISLHPPAMIALLNFGHLGGASSRCGVSIADNGRPVLWLWVDLSHVDTTALHNTLDGFLATAVSGHQILTDSLATALPPAATAGRSGSADPFAGYLRV